MSEEIIRSVLLKAGFKTFGFGGGRADVWEPEEENDDIVETSGSMAQYLAALKKTQ